MIVELSLLAIGLSASAFGALALRRRRPSPEAPPVVVRTAPLAGGDAVVLDAGRGESWSLQRTVRVHEGDADPCLLLFEALTDGAATRVVAWDPTRPEQIALLAPDRRLERAQGASLEVELDGVAVLVRTALRRAVTSTGDVPDGLLPTGTVQLTVLRGDDRVEVVVLRAEGGAAVGMVGRSVALHAVSVLPGTPPDPA